MPTLMESITLICNLLFRGQSLQMHKTFLLAGTPILFACLFIFFSYNTKITLVSACLRMVLN